MTIHRNVLLFAYQRPAFTSEAIKNILSWKYLGNLFITIDGLRTHATPDEKNWRLETIKVVEDYAASFPKIIPLIWEDNPGLTNHSIRSLEKCFENSNTIIQLEDDNQITETGMNFLAELNSEGHTPEIRSAYNKSKHSNMHFSTTHRQTSFPIQWGTSFNQRMFESYRNVWLSKSFNPEIVRNRINSIQGINGITKKRLIRFWTEYFENSLRSARHGDVVMHYASFVEGIFYKVPLEDEVIDLSPRDWRGMNQRSSTEDIDFHENRFIQARHDGFICPECEIRNSRIQKSLTKQIGTSVRLRLQRRKRRNGDS